MSGAGHGSSTAAAVEGPETLPRATCIVLSHTFHSSWFSEEVNLVADIGREGGPSLAFKLTSTLSSFYNF